MTYDELRAALSAYMKRTDPETIGNEPVALEIARAIVGRQFFPFESERSAALVPVNGAAALPIDFGRAAAVGQDYGYVTPRDWLRLAQQSPPDGLWSRYSIFDLQLHVHPSIELVSMVYNIRPKVIAGTESNWLSELYPMVWLHAARAEQYRFIEDEQSAQVADGYWRGLAGELSGASEATRQAGGLIRMKGR